MPSVSDAALLGICVIPLGLTENLVANMVLFDKVTKELFVDPSLVDDLQVAVLAFIADIFFFFFGKGGVGSSRSVVCVQRCPRMCIPPQWP
jgi:hypothetical protein